MSFNYNECQKKVGNNKFSRFLGWLLLIFGIIIFITALLSYVNWNSKKNNYIKEYVYSEFGTLYYESNGNKVYIQNVYNTDNEKITIDIPNNYVVIMYIDKNNIHDGIYFDSDNTNDQSMLNPTMSLYVTLFLVAFGLYFILTYKEQKENKTTIKPLFLIFVFIFLLGIGFIVFEGYNALNYFNLKSQNNIATATIYSQLHNKGTEENLYKPVAYYYVDGEKYIYVNDTYEKGSFENKLGTTFELYYEKSNPSKVSKKENPVDFKILILGIGLALFSLPFIFFKNKMDRRFQKNILKQNENDWKI